MQDQIAVVFHTNVDCPKGLMWRFPKTVCCKPEIGEYVASEQGTLKICRIVHCFDKSTLKPFLLIELTKG